MSQSQAPHASRLSLRGIVKAFGTNTVLHGIDLDVREGEIDRKSTRLNSSHSGESRMPSSA